ncbi:hypothetical protein AAMO2058_000365700 [Amorphochlora amoebiformis]
MSTSRLRRLPTILSVQSHVVYGAAGNSAAVFPMRRLGAEVWPLHTVQFSNHTQYGAWEGLPTPTEQISKLIEGIEARGVLGRCDALLSGYLGSAEQGWQIISSVDRIKKAHPGAVYCCDPVMGHPEKGCIVPDGVQEFFRLEALPAADVICPNYLELGYLSGSEAAPPSTPSECVEAARGLIEKGPSVVLVKHLAQAGLFPDEKFEMLLVTKDRALHVTTPLLDFDRPPTGVGDLTTGIFLVKLLQGVPLEDALGHTAAAYFAVMRATFEANEYELQTVPAQDEIVKPEEWYEVKSIDAKS